MARKQAPKCNTHGVSRSSCASQHSGSSLQKAFKAAVKNPTPVPSQSAPRSAKRAARRAARQQTRAERRAARKQDRRNRQARRGVRNEVANGGGVVAADYGISDWLTRLDGNGVTSTGFRASGRGCTVSPDGTKIVWDDTTYNKIYGGTMSTPYDPSTMLRDSEHAEWQSNNFGSNMSPDGVTLIQTPVNSIDYGVASTPWDIDTLAGRSYVNPGFPSTGNQFQGCAFSGDGSQMYVGRTNQLVRAYDLPTAFDMSSIDATTVAQEYDWSAHLPADQAFAIGHIAFSTDGLKLFTCATQVVLEHRLSTAWDISTASFSGVTMITDLGITGIHYDGNDTSHSMWIMTTGNCYKYSQMVNAAPAFDSATAEGRPISHMPITAEDSYGTPDFGTFGIAFNLDGTKMFVANTGSSGRIEEWPLSTPYDPSSAGTLVNSIAEVLASPSSLTFSANGERMFQSDNNEIRYWDLSTAFDLSTAGASVTHAMTTVTTRGVCFNTDGTKMYEVNTNEDMIEWDLSTPWLPSSKSLVTTVDIIADINQSTAAPNPSGMIIDSTGQRVYIVAGARYIHEFYLATPWDLDSYINTGRRNRSSDTINGMFLHPDGTKLYTSHSTKTIKTHTYQAL